MKNNKKQPFHIRHNYKRYISTNGYKFWAKDEEDANSYCKRMEWKLKGLYEKEK